jgi:hypothetical protein
MKTTTEKGHQGAAAAERFRLSDFVIALLGVLVLCAAAVAVASAKPAPQTSPGDPLDPRTYEPKAKPFLELHATGVQKYTCQANGTWLFTDPDAMLFKTKGKGKEVGAHFLNFSTGRPVWRYEDGSSVEAARTASAGAGAANIPWLLLEAIVTTEGEDGDRLERTSWVQRLNTSGGTAPAVPCTPGAQQAVPYAADYVFWRTPGHGDDED